MAAVMSATDSAQARDEWRLAIHRRSMRGFANACRLVGIDRDGAAFGRGYSIATVNAIEANWNGVDPLLVQAVRNETRFLLCAYVERGEALQKVKAAIAKATGAEQ